MQQMPYLLLYENMLSFENEEVERLENPMQQMSADVEELAAKEKGHLEKMGFSV